MSDTALEELNIPVDEGVSLLIYSAKGYDACYQITEEDCAANGDCSVYQLAEGQEYEYEFTDEGCSFVLPDNHEIVFPSKHHPYRGRLRTGIYVGELELKTNSGKSVALEIRSTKTDYRTAYRQMMEDITSQYVELVMMQGAPVTQKFEVDYEKQEPDTLYQKFAFVKSVVGSEDFEIAIQKIIGNPVRQWTTTTTETRIENIKRLGRNQMRQLVTRTDRIPMPATMYGYMPTELHSLPRHLTTTSHTDTVDTLENRFIKYVLTTFYDFCAAFDEYKNASPRLKMEANEVCNKLAALQNNNFFRQVGDTRRLNLNSPILQRKEGYREVLQAWLMFDLAAKLTWQGGDNVYKAGSRNVAALYEYWLFFQLMEVVEKLFDIPTTEKKHLVELSDNDINLSLKQGRQLVVGGACTRWNRRLNVKLYYNRTFSHRINGSTAGTWTAPMRPDYTLSIWPGTMRDTEAEEKDLIVHIHFDAKYRINRFTIFGDETSETDTDEELNEQLDEEKDEQERGTYKRADLLKMHAYKDAIRRTAGAYILYPGTEGKKEFRGFHEIIPGLGAFCVRPGDYAENDKNDLTAFITQVTEHMLDRISQREQIAAYDHSIHSQPKTDDLMLCDALPEYNSNEPANLPTEIMVAIGYVHGKEHQDWINVHHLYNFRAGDSIGSLPAQFLAAKYVLLHNGQEVKFYKVGEKGAKIFSKNDLLRLTPQCGYNPSNNTYIVFDIMEPENEFAGYRWDINTVLEKSEGNGNKFSPHYISLANLMLIRKKAE